MRKGLPVSQSLSLWERWHCEAMTERASPAGKSRCAAISSCFVKAILSLCQSCFAASLPSQSRFRSPRPGCGSQRLLRCRSHPAGRCPNSSSLFPPLAAVVAVAPKGGAIGMSVRSMLDEQSTMSRKQECSAVWASDSLTRCACPEAAALCSKARAFAPCRASGVQWKVTRPAKGSPSGGAVTEGD